MSGPKHSTGQRATLIVLGLLLASTVFLLPQFVTEPWVADESAELPPLPEASPSTVAPSTAAELTQYRRESQELLAEVVIMRDRLSGQNVDRWAEPDFRQALALVESGDESYGYGEYAASLDRYRQARDRLAELEALGQEKLAAAKVEVAAAVEALNLNLARSSIGLADLIAPEDPDVRRLAGRVDVLPQVAAYIESGDQALARDRFGDAQAEYRKAAELDPLHRRAAESLETANREVTASAFRNQMSRGFAALERQDFEGARAAFRDAGRISPGDPAVARALAQVANLEAGNYVGAELERALSFESQELWSEAVSIYETLLAEDPSLTDAKVRLIPARVRTDLDARLVAFIDEPLGLSNRSQYEAAQVALADARGIPQPGPRLQQQIDRLDTLIKRANTPVNVVFRSDNQTHVVLFRVADLGLFEQQSLQLRPGKYVVSGTRPGYRDVRVEFTITGDALAEPIVVRCEEPIG